jgi:hypothetical protein
VKAGVIGGVVAGDERHLLGGRHRLGHGRAGHGRRHHRRKSQAAAVRTLGAALGIPDSVAAGDYTAGAGGKVVTAALTSVPTLKRATSSRARIRSRVRSL